MAAAIDLFMVYNFIKLLVRPFEEWEAYEYGIIDKDGNILRKRRDLTRVSERKAWGVYHIMISKLKKLMGKIPGGRSKLASYSAALWLIKEHNNLKSEQHDDLESLVENNFENEEYLSRVQTEIMEMMYKVSVLKEEGMAVNNVSGGQVAGLDIEVPFYKKAQDEWKRKNKRKIFKRKKMR